MNRSAKLRVARMAGGVLMLAAIAPAVTAGAALAADGSANQPNPAVTSTATDTSTSTASPTDYADQVGIGTAVKIAGPGAASAHPAASKSPVTQTTTSLAPVGDDTATPTGAVVIETESHQAATTGTSEDPTAVAVLGTKISGNQLASTGPSHVGLEALLAAALIALGAALRLGPGLVTAAVSRRH